MTGWRTHVLLLAGSISACSATALEEDAPVSERRIAPLAPDIAAGEVITGADDSWQWIEFPETRCRLGSSAGISVNLHSASDRVMIFLSGGGGCFNAETCAVNPYEIGDSEGLLDFAHAAWLPPSAGLFDRGNPANPVKDWNFVFVPYCTGDIHGGVNPNGQVPGVDGVQQFVGRSNLAAFLTRLVPTFAGAQQVLLTGSSAGGFGASSNWAFVQQAFGTIPVTMIDDSGPIFSQSHLPRCLAELQSSLWGLEGSVLADCGSACDPDGDSPAQLLDYAASFANGVAAGLISSDKDATIRRFFGIGTNLGADDCMGSLLGEPMPPAAFGAGLRDYRARVQPYPTFGTFFPDSEQHMWLVDNSLYSATAGGVPLVDWINGVLANGPATHAGL